MAGQFNPPARRQSSFAITPIASSPNVFMLAGTMKAMNIYEAANAYALAAGMPYGQNVDDLTGTVCTVRWTKHGEPQWMKFDIRRGTT